MEFEPKPPFTIFENPQNLPAELRGRTQEERDKQDAWYTEYLERLTIRCNDPYRLAQLEMKLEEYTRRALSSTKPEVVRDSISKMAILDLMIRSEDRSVLFMDAFKYATEGLNMYGGDLLITSWDEANEFSEEFYRSFETIESYVESGNDHVVGGTQLLEAI